MIENLEVSNSKKYKLKVLVLEAEFPHGSHQAFQASLQNRIDGLMKNKDVKIHNIQPYSPGTYHCALITYYERVRKSKKR